MGIGIAKRFMTFDEEMACRERMADEECPAFERVSGLCICERCGQEYFAHPRCDPFLDLTVLCDGRYVKL